MEEMWSITLGPSSLPAQDLRATENAGVENVAPDDEGGKRGVSVTAISVSVVVSGKCKAAIPI